MLPEAGNDAQKNQWFESNMTSLTTICFGIKQHVQRFFISFAGRLTGINRTRKALIWGSSHH